MATSNSLVLIVLIVTVAGLLGLVITVLGRKSKRETRNSGDDSPFAELITRNRLRELDNTPTRRQPAPASEHFETEAPTVVGTDASRAALLQQLAPDLSEDLRAGRKIEAIKRVREAFGCGLKEAKDTVERFQASRQLDVGPSSAHPGLGVEQRAVTSFDDPTVIDRAREYLARGQKIQAVKVVRDMTNCGLKEAKDFVERL